MNLASGIDGALEWPIVPSFSRIGFDVRRRIERWESLDQIDATGRVVVITGPTSGLGRATADMLASLGATLVLVGRSRSRTEVTASQLREAFPDVPIDVVVADLGELEAVRAAAAEIASAHPRIDVLIHNAGALSRNRMVSRAGTEFTVSSQVLGPFLLTSLLLESLRAARPGRVLTMSSGGMYAAPLTVSGLELGPADYNGTQQYALAKRAQVTLNEMWAERIPATDVVFHAMHPGWADTPGVEESLPGFRRVMRPLLRDAPAGADTMVWLAVADEPLASSGGFWLDRHERPIHRLRRTRRTDTPERRAELWDWVRDRAGVDPAPIS